MTFIVRLTTDAAGICGVIERVSTGEKHRFYGLEALAPLLARLVAAEATDEANPRGRTPC